MRVRLAHGARLTRLWCARGARLARLWCERGAHLARSRCARGAHLTCLRSSHLAPGIIVDSFTGNDTAIPAKASACTLSPLGISSMTHSLSRLSDSCTFNKYLTMRSSLASYSFSICPTTSWELLWILTFETFRVVAWPNPDRMTSYSASLFEAGKSRRMDCSNRSPVGALRRSPTPYPDEREAPSTCIDHQSSEVDSLSGARASSNSAIKSVMTCPFRDSLG